MRTTTRAASSSTWFLSPATACLAVAIYGKIRILKENWLPILVGCTVGSAASMGSILLLCRLFGLDAAVTASLVPKSVTTPIALSIAQSHGGIGPITVVAVILTGIIGSIAAPLLIRLFRVRDPMTAGLAIGRLLPRGGHIQGPGARGDRGGHERLGHRRVRYRHRNSVPLPALKNLPPTGGRFFCVQ